MILCMISRHKLQNLPTYVLKFGLVRGTARSIFESAALISVDGDEVEARFYSCGTAPHLAGDCLRETLASTNTSPSCPSSPELISNSSYECA